MYRSSQALEHLIEEHLHNSCSVYPTAANDVTVTGAAGAWTLGNFAEIIPASTVTNPFDIHYIYISSISANDQYELVLYYGASDTECARIRFVKSAAFEGTMHMPIITPIIPANSRVRAKVMSKGGGADTVDISVFYHDY